MRVTSIREQFNWYWYVQLPLVNRVVSRRRLDRQFPWSVFDTYVFSSTPFGLELTRQRWGRQFLGWSPAIGVDDALRLVFHRALSLLGSLCSSKNFDISLGSLPSSVTRRFCREVGIRFDVTDFQSWRSTTVFMCTFLSVISLSSTTCPSIEQQCLMPFVSRRRRLSAKLILQPAARGRPLWLGVQLVRFAALFCSELLDVVLGWCHCVAQHRAHSLSIQDRCSTEISITSAWISVSTTFFDNWAYRWDPRVCFVISSLSRSPLRTHCHGRCQRRQNVSSLCVSVLSCFQNVTFRLSRSCPPLFVRVALFWEPRSFSFFLDVERRQINAFPLMKGCPRFIDHWISRCDDLQFESLWYVTMYLHVEQGYRVIEWWSRKLEQEFLHFGCWRFFFLLLWEILPSPFLGWRDIK